MTNAREVAQLTETLKQKVQAEAQRIRRYEKGKPSIVRIRCLKKKQKNFQKPGHEEPPSMAEAETYWKSLWGEEAQHNEEQNG